MQFTSSLTKDHLENTTLTRAKLMLPYFRIKTLKRHTLLDIYTYLSSRYMGVLPPLLPSPPLPHAHAHTHPRTKSGMERSVQFTLTCRKSLSKLCLCVNYPLVKKKKNIKDAKITFGWNRIGRKSILPMWECQMWFNMFSEVSVYIRLPAKTFS